MATAASNITSNVETTVAAEGCDLPRSGKSAVLMVDENVNGAIITKSNADEETCPELDTSSEDGSDESSQEGEEQTEDEQSQLLSQQPASDNKKEEEDEAAAEDLKIQSMELNDAFLALEDMRKAHLDYDFGGGKVKAIRDISRFHEYCTMCLQEVKEREQRRMNHLKGKERQQRAVVAWQRFRFTGRSKSPPCLVCANPVCGRHCCQDFRKEGLTICAHCAPLFTIDFVVHTLSNDSEEHRRACLAHMLDSYDRALLILQYSAQFIDDIADALQNNTRKFDHIGLGSSGIGIMSGVTGMGAVAAKAAAAVTAVAFMSPAGPPLLIASILFGGTAAAASTGTEAVAHFSEPNQLANKILALAELVHSLVAVTDVIKEALEKGEVNEKHYTVANNGRSRGRVNSMLRRQSSSNLEAESPSSSVSDEADKKLLLGAVEETDVIELELESDDDAESDKDDANNKEEQVQGLPSKEEVGQNEAVSDDEPAIENLAPAVGATPPSSTEVFSDIEPETDEAVEGNHGTNSVNESTEPDEASKEFAAASTALVVVASEGGAATSGQTETGKEETSKETVKVEEEALSDGRKSGIVCVMPLAPLIDDLLLSMCQIFTATRSNASVAVSRAATNSLKVAQIATVMCGALSAATILLESNNMKNVWKRLKAGSPCDKAKMLLKVKEEMKTLPSTKEIAQECKRYLRATVSQEEENKVEADDDDVEEVFNDETEHENEKENQGSEVKVASFDV